MPTVHPTAYIHPAAHVIGDVTLGARVSVWPTTVLRGDTAAITVGEDTNLQDGTIVHVDRGVLKLSPDDVEADGIGTCRKYSAPTVRKIALLHALTQAGVQPRIAGRYAEQYHNADVAPGDLLIIDRHGVGEITSNYVPGTHGQFVLDLGTLFAELDSNLAVAS